MPLLQSASNNAKNASHNWEDASRLQQTSRDFRANGIDLPLPGHSFEMERMKACLDDGQTIWKKKT